VDVTDSGATNQFKGSSLQMTAFFMNHPTIAIVTLWLIAIVGFLCILELPIGWALF
jgi:hypothetical protein